MKETTKKILNELLLRRKELSPLEKDIENAFLLLKRTAESGGTLFLCGNGGSASDCEHIVGELMKSFKKERPIQKDVYNALEEFGEEGKKLQSSLEGTIRAISLTSHPALSTAFANDKDPDSAFAQKLYGWGKKGDGLIAISTSGNSSNCVLSATLAKAMGITSIALTGQKESRLSQICDVSLRVPESETFKVQELHLPLYHCLCAMLEEELF